MDDRKVLPGWLLGGVLLLRFQRSMTMKRDWRPRVPPPEPLSVSSSMRLISWACEPPIRLATLQQQRVNSSRRGTVVQSVTLEPMGRPREARASDVRHVLLLEVNDRQREGGRVPGAPRLPRAPPAEVTGQCLTAPVSPAPARGSHEDLPVLREELQEVFDDGLEFRTSTRAHWHSKATLRSGRHHG